MSTPATPARMPTPAAGRAGASPIIVARAPGGASRSTAGHRDRCARATARAAGSGRAFAAAWSKSARPRSAGPRPGGAARVAHLAPVGVDAAGRGDSGRPARLRPVAVDSAADDLARQLVAGRAIEGRALRALVVAED